METNTFDYKKLRSEIFLKHHIELDETSLSILHILLVETTTELSAMTESIHAATDKVNNSITSLQVDYHHPRWQAFWFGMGKLGLAIMFSASLLCMTAFVYTVQKYDYGQIDKERSWYKNCYELLQAGKTKELKNFLKNNPVSKD